MIKKFWVWIVSEKVLILWTSVVGLIWGIVVAGPTDSLSSVWLGKVIAGSASSAILFGVLNRYVIALNRE